MTRKLTIGFILFVIFAVIAYDVWVWIEPTSGDTISEVIRDYGSRSWFVLVSLGVLLGHFFWNAKKVDYERRKWTMLGLLVLGVILLCIDIIANIAGAEWHRLFSGAWVLLVAVGVVFGRLGWPLQARSSEDSKS